MSSRRAILRRLPKMIFGLAIFALGVYLAVSANIGLAPWDTLSMGVSYRAPLSFGGASIAVSVLVVLIDLLLREKIGLGTILNAFLVGLFIDAYDRLGIIPEQSNVPLGIAIMVAGLFAMGLGQYFYMTAALGCGPRDTLLMGLGRRFPKIPIGAVNTAILAVVLVAGWLLGAPIGIGTVISTFGIGVAMQIVFRLLRFEPRGIAHEGLIETARALFGPKGNGEGNSKTGGIAP